jgi:penicillin-binding protein 2
MASPSPDASAVLRLTLLSVLVIALFLALFARLWFLQVLAGDRYVELADNNSLRSVPSEAPRGSILGIDGEELVRNRPALTISADRQTLLDGRGEPRDEEAARVIDRLGELLELTPEQVIARLGSQRRSALAPVTLEIDVAPEIAFAVREQQELFPGVVTETLPVREYPGGRLASHLVGYLGEISQDELLDPAFTDYRGGDLVGRAGLEQVYEEDLRGVTGERLLLVNARGNVLDVQRERDAIQGDDLVTTIDPDLQRAVETLLEEGIVASRNLLRDDGQNLPSVAGSAVALDARTGGVLAMASYPSYDPREFVGGVSGDYWRFVNDRENEQPLRNRVIGEVYPPGSVFKTASGAAMMEAGLVGPRSTVNCAPSFELGGISFRNWNRGVNEGPMDLSDALMRSCDTYFYDLAYRQYQREQNQDDPDEVLVRVAERFGFGVSLGIDLPGEQPGRVPGRQWREDYHRSQRDALCSAAEAASPGSEQRALLDDLCRYGGAWRGGDAVNSSIGQGDVLATPLQVASSYQAIAHDGVLMRPHVGARIVAQDGTLVREIEPQAIGDLQLDDGELAVIKEGLERVIMDPRGTGRTAFAGFPVDEIPIAGKTGTAEIGGRIPYAWFAGYAPADDPEIVVAVNVEQGGGGSQTAAPIVRNIFEHYFGVVDADDAEFEAGAEILD